jgi:HSP20 family protein
MALIRWEPARELQSMQSEMNRLFGTFFDSPTPRNGARTSLRRWIPAMDVVETDDHYVLRTDLPGLDESDVNVELENNVLTISGKRSTEHEERKNGYHRVERSTGSFSRSVTLPDGVDADGIEANFDKGVLEVKVAKPEQIKPRKVAIAVGSAPAAAESIEAGEPTEAGESIEAGEQQSESTPSES